MDSERWQRLSQKFEELCDLTPEGREERLRLLESEAPELVGELRAMLAADADERGGILAAGAAAFAGSLSGTETPAIPNYLAAGQQLGPHEIESLLGAGGMGEVYRARDTRLDRAVAIKVIASARGSGEALRQRFRHEARAVSRLQHPHICALFDVGSQDGIDFLVMELLEGETLSARLKRGALPLDQVLRFGREVAEALDYAHRQGIVHRDLKPANVMLTRAGAKLLDFGIARIRPGGPLPAGEAALTAEGTILGTVQYMAPEQLEGKESDARTDIFALGTMLHEMATGRPAFAGESPASLISAILSSHPPPISSLQKLAPTALDRLVRSCLAKDPDERWQSARDVATQLAGIAEAGSEAATDPPRMPRGFSASRVRKLRNAVVAVLAAAAAVWVVVQLGAFAKNPPPPAFRQQTFRRGTLSSARFAPDGQTIIYSAAWEGGPYELYSTRRGSAEARPLGIERARILAISAAGEMAFLIGGQRLVMGQGMLVRAPLAGGAPRELLAEVREADWTSTAGELAVVRNAGVQDLVELPIGNRIHEAPAVWSLRVSRHEDRVAFFAGGGHAHGDLFIGERSGAVRALSTGWVVGSGLAWSPDDDEIWFTGTRGDRAPAIWAISLSGKERLLAQGPTPLHLQDLYSDGAALVSSLHMRKQLTCKAPGVESESELGGYGGSWVEDLSMDGGTVLYSEEDAAGGATGVVYVGRTDGSPALRLGEGHAEGLSPDGRRALVRNRTSSEYTLLPVGPGSPRSLPSADLETRHEGDWLNESQIVFSATEKGHKPRIYVQNVNDGTVRPLTPEGASLPINAARPDGRAVLARIDGQTLLYPVDGGEPLSLRHLEPADQPLQWSADGRYLYVRRGGTRPPVEIQRLDITTGERISWLKLEPEDAVGVERLHPIVLTPDGRGYCYTYSKVLNDLFLVEGLH